MNYPLTKIQYNMKQNNIKTKTASIAPIELQARATTKFILSKLKIEPELKMRLKESSVFEDSITLKFSHFYYDACIFLVRRIRNDYSLFGADDSIAALDIQQMACIFTASKDLEATVGIGEIYSRALHKIIGNKDLMTFYLAAFIFLTNAARSDRKPLHQN